jgi:hypothetical protein
MSGKVIGKNIVMLAQCHNLPSPGGPRQAKPMDKDNHPGIRHPGIGTAVMGGMP